MHITSVLENRADPTKFHDIKETVDVPVPATALAWPGSAGRCWRWRTFVIGTGSRLLWSIVDNRAAVRRRPIGRSVAIADLKQLAIENSCRCRVQSSTKSSTSFANSLSLNSTCRHCRAPPANSWSKPRTIVGLSESARESTRVAGFVRGRDQVRAPRRRRTDKSAQALEQAKTLIDDCERIASLARKGPRDVLQSLVSFCCCCFCQSSRWRLWSRSRDAAVPFSSTQFAESICVPPGGSVSPGCPAALTLAAIALLIVALARPREGRQQTIVDSEGIAMEMVVDRSGSMRAMDFQIDGQHVDRLTAIKNVAGRFIQGDDDAQTKRRSRRPRQRPRRTHYVCRMRRRDYAADARPCVRDGPTESSGSCVSRREEDGTAIGDAISLAVEKLNARRLLTDRQSTTRLRAKSSSCSPTARTTPATSIRCKPPSWPKQWASRFTRSASALAARPRCPFAIRSRASNESNGSKSTSTKTRSKKLRTTTGGKYFRATDTESLAVDLS